MTDRDLVLRKLAVVREHAQRVRRRSAGGLAALEADIDRQDALSLSLLVSIQECVDIAFHLSAAEGWGVPATYAEAFALLGSRGVVDDEIAAAMARAAGLRNRLAHTYAEVDIRRLHGELPAGLDALDRFVAAMASWLGNPGSGRE